VVLIDGHPRHAWLLKAVNRRLREELARLHVELNEEKSRAVDLAKGESFGFLGFDVRRVRSLRGVGRPHTTPRLKKRTALLRKLKAIFRRHRSQPLGWVVQAINPILRGWVRYFRIGNSSDCFSFVKRWVEQKVRRHVMRSRERPGFGWRKWSMEWVYRGLGLFDEYLVRYYTPRQKAPPAGGAT
jgi:RNA-directed DNA polymerase